MKNVVMVEVCRMALKKKVSKRIYNYKGIKNVRNQVNQRKKDLIKGRDIPNYDIAKLKFMLVSLVIMGILLIILKLL
mgnify:CR=1 FL=1